jgi:hypothetical protein
VKNWFQNLPFKFNLQRYTTGPVTSYVVISDPDAIKQVLFNYGNKYIKGTIAEAGEFLFGRGCAAFHVFTTTTLFCSQNTS